MQSFPREKLVTIIAGLGLADNAEKQEFCLSIITNLAVEEQWRTTLAEFKAVPPIVRLIASEKSTDVMKMLSCWALSNINSEEISPDTQASIDGGELLPALSRLLEEELYNEDILEKVLWLLTNITTSEPDNKIAAASSDLDILGNLVAMLEFDEERATSNNVPLEALEFSEKMVVEASKPLLNLFFEESIQLQFFEFENSILNVVTLLACESPTVQAAMLNLVLMLTAFNDEIKQKILEEGLVPRLASLTIASNDNDTLETAMKVLCNISNEDHVPIECVKNGTVLTMADLLAPDCGSTFSLKCEVIAALHVMSFHEEVRTTMRHTDGIISLVSMLEAVVEEFYSDEDRNCEILGDLVPLLVNLSMDAKNRTVMKSVDCPKIITKVLEFPVDGILHENVNKALRNMQIPDPDGGRPITSRTPPPPIIPQQNIQLPPPSPHLPPPVYMPPPSPHVPAPSPIHHPPPSPHIMPPPSMELSATGVGRGMLAQEFGGAAPVQQQDEMTLSSTSTNARASVSVPRMGGRGVAEGTLGKISENAYTNEASVPSGPLAPSGKDTLGRTTATPGTMRKVVNQATLRRNTLRMEPAPQIIQQQQQHSSAMSEVEKVLQQAAPPQTPAIPQSVPEINAENRMATFRARKNVDRNTTVISQEDRIYLKRRFIAKEILDTEQSYVKHLRFMVEHYLNPLKEKATKTGGSRFIIIPVEDLKTIFGVSETIYAVNSAFLKQLEAAMEWLHDDLQLQLGDPFIAVTKSFKMYSAYANNFDRSSEVLDKYEKSDQYKAYKKSLEPMAQAEKCKVELRSLLIMPIQRIPRYILLLRDLLDKTPPSHPDHPKLSIAYPLMEEVASFIEEEKDKHENLHTMFKLSKQIIGFKDAFITPNRKLVKEGIVLQFIPETKRSKYRYLFFFSDIFMLTDKVKKRNKKDNLEYKFVESLVFQNQAQPITDSYSLKNAFKLHAGGKEWTLYTTSKNDSDSWIRIINKQFETNKNPPKGSKQRATGSVLLQGPGGGSVLAPASIHAGIPIGSFLSGSTIGLLTTAGPLSPPAFITTTTATTQLQPQQHPLTITSARPATTTTTTTTSLQPAPNSARTVRPGGNSAGSMLVQRTQPQAAIPTNVGGSLLVPRHGSAPVVPTLQRQQAKTATSIFESVTQQSTPDQLQSEQPPQEPTEEKQQQFNITQQRSNSDTPLPVNKAILDVASPTQLRASTGKLDIPSRPAGSNGQVKHGTMPGGTVSEGDVLCWLGGRLPQTPEEIEKYKMYMIKRYQEDAEKNKMLLEEIRKTREEKERKWAMMSEKERRKSIKVEEKEKKKVEKKK